MIEGKKVNNITGAGHHSRVKNWRRHNATEAEEAYICGNFLVKPISDGAHTLAEFRQPAGRNLTQEGFPFYCGRVALTANFDLADKTEERVLLKLVGINAASARVEVNGQYRGALRWAPFVIDISEAVRQGANTLKVELATTLVNAFGPNRMAGIKEETGIGPGSFCDMSRFKESHEFFDFGLTAASIYRK